MTYDTKNLTCDKFFLFVFVLMLPSASHMWKLLYIITLERTIQSQLLGQGGSSRDLSMTILHHIPINFLYIFKNTIYNKYYCSDFFWKLRFLVFFLEINLQSFGAASIAFFASRSFLFIYLTP